MKKIPTFLFLLVTALFLNLSANAQSSPQTAGPVNLSITLSDVISIELVSPDVAFIYDAVADYGESQSVTKNGHLIVNSNQPYNISVAADAEFAVTGGALDLGIVKISVDPTTLNGGTATLATLSLTDALLVSSAIPAVNASYNVNYTIPDPVTLLGLDAQTITTTITYTATQI